VPRQQSLLKRRPRKKLLIDPGQTNTETRNQPPKLLIFYAKKPVSKKGLALVVHNAYLPSMTKPYYLRWVCISGESGSERCWLLPSKRLPEQAVDEANRADQANPERVAEAHRI
jgi:hypothetical protein